MKKGFSLLEVLVALAVGSLVTSVMLVTLSGGLNVASHLWGEQEVLLRAELLSARMQPDFCEADLAKARLIKDAILVPVALDQGGHFQTDAAGRPLWSGCQLYYEVGGQACSRRVASNVTDEEIARLTTTPSAVLADRVRALHFRIFEVARTDPIRGRVVQIPALVEAAAMLQYRDRRGRLIERMWSRQFLARNSLAALHHEVFPEPDDPPAPVLNLPDIPAGPTVLK